MQILHQFLSFHSMDELNVAHNIGKINKKISKK